MSIISPKIHIIRGCRSKLYHFHRQFKKNIFSKSASQILHIVITLVSRCVCMCVCVCVCVCVFVRVYHFVETFMLPSIYFWEKPYKRNLAFPVEWRKSRMSSLDLDLYFQGQTFSILFDLRVSHKWWETANITIAME